MTLLRVKDGRAVCRWQLLTKWPGSSMIRAEYKCCLPRDHDGPHRSNQGMVWDNRAKRLEQWEQEADPVRAKIILPGNR